MNPHSPIKKFWKFLNEDSWQSWLVSIILLIIIIKFAFFPALSFITGSSLPLVVVESCSMYHETDFNNWWEKNSEWYRSKSIEKEKFESFPLKNGFNKGDIIFVWGHSAPNLGDIIIFKPNEDASAEIPIIHRVITTDPIGTKGDHNAKQLASGNNSPGIDETNIKEERIIGKAAFRVPFVGWLKLIFFEPLRSPQNRGFCR